MHKLTRNQEPESLSHARKKYPVTDVWGDLSVITPATRQEIRETLFKMQGHFCAYCERSVTPERGHYDKSGHIEHFRCRSVEPTLSLDWNNMFYSCSTQNTCGKHKDCLPRGTVDYQKLINPCIDNPEDYFAFSSPGYITPREELSDEDKARAEETIRVFGLNEIRYEREEISKKYDFLLDYPELIESTLSGLTSENFITMLYSKFGKRRVS